MKMLKPTLQVNKIIITKENKVAYSAEFHTGLNIITGQNSSGKTTILDCIAYTLGMEEIKLKNEALSCDFCYLEISINGQTLCLKREISEHSRRPISILYDELKTVDQETSEWLTFPINRSEKISYSQIMFNLMDSSEKNLDASSNLTMHQILRSIYAAQKYLHFPILTPSTHDDALIRKTIGEYLLGFYNNDLYIMQIQHKEKVKNKEKLKTESNFLKNIFKKSYFPFNNKQSAEKHLDKLKIEKIKINQELNNTKRTPKKLERDNLKQIESLNKTINSLYLTKQSLEIQKNQLYLNSLDSQIFINEIIDRLERLEESKFVQSFSHVSFEFCPSCLSKLENNSSKTCNLCKCDNENTDEYTSPLLRMKNELLIQLEESKKIELLRNDKINVIKIQIIKTSDEIRTFSTQVNNLSEHWSDTEKANLTSLSFKLGKIDTEISEINKLIPIYDELEDLNNRIIILGSEITQLESEITNLEESNYQNRLKTLQLLELNLINLLKLDLPRESEFIDPQHISISFTDNQIYVNNKNKFSESSTVILRHLFHLALLKTADNIPNMRFPRLLILDGIDDGGLEPERIINLQKIILSELNTLKNSYQVILATSIDNLSEAMHPYIYTRKLTTSDKSIRI
ncbi:hypothetical protein ACK2M2_02610 [Acinetobacter sp. TY1]|uniref:hypothetical protein n=1 Tax=Acinetobacter sp. TY1 TaxID=3387626 RepID=UPI003AF5C7FA